MNKTSSKQPLSSPRRVETLALPLMKILSGTFFGGNGKSTTKKSRPFFRQRRRLTAILESQPEPSSPKVTCTGQVKASKTASSKSRRRLKSPFLGKCASFFKTVCSCGYGNLSRLESEMPRDDRVQSDGEAEGANAECGILPVTGPPSPTRNKFLLTRSKSVSSEVSKLWSFPSASKAETRDSETEAECVHVCEKDDNPTSETEPPTHTDPERENRIRDRVRKKFLSDPELDFGGKKESECEAVFVKLRCKSDPGRALKRFVSDPELELRRKKESESEAVVVKLRRCKSDPGRIQKSSPYLPPLSATCSKSKFSDQAAGFSNRRNHLKWKKLYVPSSGCDENGSGVKNIVESFGKGFLGLSVATAVAVSLSCDSLALAESLTVAFPASRAREVNTVQRTLVEAWGLIRDTFVDPTFNHQDWDSKLQQTMVEIFPLRTADAAYNKISGMLSTLGDPFTRIISPKEYQSFRIGSDGNLQGVGLFINVEPSTGQLVVMSCVEGSPAARAGIHGGDELVEINGERLDGIDSEAAAQKLRGPYGTTVTVKLHSGKDAGNSSEIREVKLPRENIRLSPISSAIINHRTPDGHISKTGYVKLAAFSQTAAVDMEDAIYDMEDQGVESYILDLRNNPGGLVKAGLDVAQIWLDGDETLVNTIDRDGNMLPINIVDGHAITHDPLVVLVNEGSASASEILAGALHDNGRAVLVGHKTFGKGRIQSVTELHDGSALFITVAKYLSPALHDIDKVGITPDIQCTTEMLNATKEVSLKDKSVESALEADSCIMVAEHELDIQQSKGTAS
ncbi:unnamed protein product [Rhodiola kirilowii]